MKYLTKLFVCFLANFLLSFQTVYANPLKEIKIVDDWSPVINFQAFKQKSKSTNYEVDFYSEIFSCDMSQ